MDNMTAHPATGAAQTSQRIAALIVILTAQLMLQMDFLIVMVALPQIQQDLGFEAATLSWVPNAFALVFGGLLLLGGRAGDIFGRVRTFQMGLTLFVLASLLGGLAQDAFTLIMARALQGAGAAIAAPSVLALISTIARNDAERNRGMALFIAVSSVGASAGLILGGAITAWISWRWSLLINVPVGLLVLIFVGRFVKETEAQPGKFDIAGATTACIGSMLFVFGFINAADNGWLAPATLTSLVVSLFFFATFWFIEHRAKQPLLEPSLFNNPLRIASLTVMALIVGVHFSLLFLIVQFFQQVMGFGPLVSGLAYLPVTCTVFAVTHFMPVLLARFGPAKLLFAGSVLVALSFCGFAVLGEQSRYLTDVFSLLVVHSIGIALVFTPATMSAMQSAPDKQAGAVSGLVQMTQQIGGAAGIAIIVAAYAAGSVPGHFSSGLMWAFALAALLGLCAALVSWMSLIRKKPSVN